MRLHDGETRESWQGKAPVTCSEHSSGISFDTTVDRELGLIRGRIGKGKEQKVPQEFRQRNAADIAWLRAGFQLAARENLRGVAVFMQANPRLDGLGSRTRRPVPDGFAELLDALESSAAAFGRPVALVHGDTHYFRVDQPFQDSTGHIRTNITRAETYGTPNLHALLMCVDAKNPNLFTFEPIIVPANVTP